MAKKDKASIYIDLQSLFSELYKSQFEMNKCDRIILGDRILDHCEKSLAFFSLAYEVEDKRIIYIEKLLAEFEMLKMDCRFAIDNNFYKSESTKATIREYISKIQEGIDKWRSFVYSARQE